MSTNKSLQSYEAQFGEINFKQGEEARSVYSPAAYLADLLQLLDDYFDGRDLKSRRTDLDEIPLDADNTFSLLPYLDIVNGLLEKKVSAAAPYETLRKSKYPLNLPFNLHDEEVKLFLQSFDVSRESVYQTFNPINPKPGSAVVAQTYLGLSSEMLGVILDTRTETSVAALKKLYSLGASDDLKALQEVSLFLDATDSTAEELLDLLQPLGLNFQDIEVSSVFFTQVGLAGYARLDSGESKLEWVSSNVASTTIPAVWFSRVNRLLRLSRQTGISLNNLNLILYSCCQNTLNTTAINTIAVIKQIASDYDLEIDVVCSFFSHLNFFGDNDKTSPSDLFNRLYNVGFANLDQQYFQVTNSIPEAYKSIANREFTALKLSGDIFSPQNTNARKRIQSALHLSTKDLKLLTTRFDEKLPKQLLEDGTEDEPANDLLNRLSLYHRVSKLAETLDVSIQDIFNLLDVLEKDPYIRNYSGFNPLIENQSNQLNGYQTLAYGSMEESLWLVQMLLALSAWLQKTQFSTAELKRILTGELSNNAEQEAQQQRRISGLNTLYQQFKPLLFDENYFVADGIDTRTARVIHDALQTHSTNRTSSTGLVSKQDGRLLTGDKTSAKAVFYKALIQLQSISSVDFKGLAVHEKMQNKLFTNLILKGILKPDGTVVESAFTDIQKTASQNQNNAEGCLISHEFDNQSVFTLIHNIQQQQQDDVFPLFLTDLEALELDSDQQKELYDNLQFNGYIDEEGNVLNPALFAEADNQAQFDSNSYLDQYTQDTYSIIKNKLSGFDEVDYSLDTSMFAALPLKNIELVDLLENLAFNDYLDENQNIVNKTEVLALQADDFKLALQYYPQRHQILEIIQSGLQDLKSRYYTLSKDDFSEMAAQIIAEDIYVQMQAEYLQEDTLSAAGQDFFADEDNAKHFQLSSYFDTNNTLIVFKTIKRMVNTAKQYRLNDNSFTELELDAEDVTELFDLLISHGYINNDKTLSANHTTYFLNINNALDIKLEGFTNFSKDIFFVIHALAKTVDSTVSDLTARYLELATQQSDSVFAALQEMFEIPVEQVKVICRHVFDKNESAVERFMLPVLTTLGFNKKSELITELPENSLFNRAYQRIQQFAWLATKLDLNAVEIDIVFRDQNLAEKYAEKLTLPDGVDHIACLFQLTIDGDMFQDGQETENEAIANTQPIEALLLYSAEHNSSWLYNAHDYQLLGQINNLSQISPVLTDLNINAAFNDKHGNAWIVSGNDFYCQQQHQQDGQLEWEKKEKELGKVQSNFDEVEHIDSAFVDQEDKLYIFAGDQYVRSSDNLTTIDEGYPKKIETNWEQELGLELPESYYESIDAVMQNADEQLYFFKDKHFISSDDVSSEQDINQFWGKVDNNFSVPAQALEKIDASLVHNNTLYFFSGDQYLTWSYNLENEHGFADEGSIQLLSTLIPNLPDEFEDGIDAIFKGFNNKIYVFKDNHSLTCNNDFNIESESNDLSNDWGKVSNPITHTGRLTAAFSGLDGNVYLFSGSKFYRYSGGKSGKNYSYVDEGYPKTIEDYWGGLSRVDAAFILDGKTYLMGSKGGKPIYLRYSSNDYSKHDTDYPKPVTANWWTDHFNLNSADFNTAGDDDGTNDFTKPDSVFLTQDGATYLFKNKHYITYDTLHRWWSEPKPIKDTWAEFEFDNVDAAFAGKDGRTYLFSATKYLRYSDKFFNKLDDRYPKTTRSFWGKVRNTIQKHNKIDAALVIQSRPVQELVTRDISHINEEGEVENPNYTYLFSGDQFVRYTDDGNDENNAYGMIDEGYPKTIAGSLKDEPRFSHLEAALNSVDTVFADYRNVYLCKGQHCTVVSDTQYQYYDHLLSETPNAVVSHEGKLYIENQHGWNTLTQLEGNALSTPTPTPPLGHVAGEEMLGIDAAFVGTDNTTYIFRKGTCYNDALERSYPLNEEWGKARNNIQIDNHIDAAFVGLDGKTYLFSGDQYLSFSGDTTVDTFIDSYPKSISEDFGGLENVNIAFIKDGKTWLLETPDEDGNFRYLCFSSDDYSKADGEVGAILGAEVAAEVEHADISWWEFPSVYIEEGFDNVDAVLFDDEHMFLFNGDQFIQYNEDDDLWTYPRPVERIWRNIPFNNQTENTIGSSISTVFTDSSNITWFFSDSHVTGYVNQNFSPVEEIKLNWGKLRNTLVQNNTVDAALVLDQTTYLFSGDQYVRYSTEDYRYIDDGYPKLIVENLRQEDGFTNLPENFDEHIKKLQSQTLTQNLENEEAKNQPMIAGIVADERNIFIFETNHCHVVSRTLTGQFPISRIGNIKNQLVSSNHVDATFVNSKEQTFLFSGDQYVRYSDTDYEYVDMGYPKSITAHFAAESGGIAIDASGASNTIDAAVQLTTGKLMLFKGNEIFQTDTQDGVSLSHLIPSQQQAFSTSSTPVNAGFVAPDGKTYFFTKNTVESKGAQYICYSDFDNEYVDEGFPRAIQDNWGNLPAEFETAIDHAFLFEGKTYLVNGNQYVRYSQADYQMIDAIYPQTFTRRWGQKGQNENTWNDYLLSDIHIISTFKALLENNLGGNRSLADLLNLELGYKKEPYQMLADIFDWDVNEIKWLKRKNAFFKNDLEVEVNFNIELVLKMQDIFTLADALNTSPSQLYNTIYQNDFEGTTPKHTQKVADSLYKQLGLSHSDKDWKLLSSELHDKLNLVKHDALLPYVITHEAGVNNARDLFANMLIDVNMGSDARTSKIKEATAAIQLYFHRYFVNLETLENPVSNRDQLKQWWKWMRNYRVWEANRKVFLYPENYIRPELRDSKTPAFKTLEESLLQGEVSQQLVTTAFHDYLNEFASVGNLKITGANVYKDPNDESKKTEVLVLFGHTITEPGKYYYRTARFTDDTLLWDNWLPLDISINSTRVFPVYAFGRILLFWTEIEAYEENIPFVRSHEKTSKVDTSDTVLKHRADIKYSFYDFNKKWINPQTLTKGIELEYKLDAAFSEGGSIIAFSGEFCLITTKQNPQGNMKRINEVYTDIPQPFDKGIDAAVLYEGQRIFFSGNQCVINSGGTWQAPQAISSLFHADTDGGKAVIEFKRFLFAPPYKTTIELPADQSVRPFQQGVGAAFTAGSKICLIDHEGQPTFFTDDTHENGSSGNNENLAFKEEIIRKLEVDKPFGFLGWAFVKIITRDVLRLDPVDAIFEYQDDQDSQEEGESGHKIIYVLRRGQFECYQYTASPFSPLEKLDGYPKPIKGNLSFNMDQFFNRLHLAINKEQGEIEGEGVLNLNYTSPESNTPLLTGKIYDDFRFIEGDLRIDFNKHLLLKTKQDIRNLSKPKMVLSAQLPSHVSQYFESTNDAISQVMTEIETDHSALLKDTLLAFNEAVGLVQGTVDAQNVDEDEDSILDDLNKVAVSTDSQKRFTELMTGLPNSPEGVITVLKTLGLPALTQHADLLSTAYTGFISADHNWQDEFATLEIALGNADSALDNASDEVTDEAKLKTLKTNIIAADITRNRQLANSLLANHKAYAITYRKHLNKLANLTVNTSPEDTKKISKSVETYTSKIRNISADAWVNQLSKVDTQTTLDDFKAQLQATQTAIKTYQDELTAVQSSAYDIEQAIDALPIKLIDGINQKIESSFGSFDLFPSSFGIENQTNFTFGEPDWHIFEAKLGTFLCRPIAPSDDSPDTTPADEGDTGKGGMNDSDNLQYEIIRLTTRTIPTLSSRLFSGGINKLLTLESQYKDEEPYFEPQLVTRSISAGLDADPTPENTILYNSDRIATIPGTDEDGNSVLIDRVPKSIHLDYKGANSNYYWEIFFHAPFLIAQTLNGAQKFEEAKSWYEFIYNPTATNQNEQWSFLPFKQAIDNRNPLPDHLNRILEVTNLKAEIKEYLNDPFDPHAIARIREVAYQKSIVMCYVDNLLDWGDMLFRQYTMESINEARMLYVLAYDLLGDKPQSMGDKVLPETQTYSDLKDHQTKETDLLLPSTDTSADSSGNDSKSTELTITENNVHTSVRSPYFHIPENDLFLDYWNRVENRLYKIRHSLNIEGVKQALPLFQPPIDPMSIVQAVAGGGSLSQIMASSNVAVPHYRFSFMLNKSRELVQTLSQFSGELLGAIEKRDAEQLSLMQNKQEAVIQNMMTQVKEAQIAEAKESITSLEASLQMVEANESYNQSTHETNFLPAEVVQIGLMYYAVQLHAASTLANIVASFGGAAPDAMVGPFIAGVKAGGSQLHDAASSIGEVAQTAAEGFSVAGELAGIMAQHERMMDDIEHQVDTAVHDKMQINAQIEGAKQQLKIAEYELAIHEKEIEQHQSITTFMTSKFSNEQLYQWMSSKLSGLYYQTYKMAYDMAKGAEKSFQFERGAKASEVNYINGMYWNSQRKGLLAGESLGLDLDRMEERFIKTNKRRFEISKQISLLELDPMAFIRFKLKGECEFNLSEALFDYDFQGHYCRQIKTIAISFDAAEGQTVNATLTQLNHKTVMEADPKAVKYLLDPKGNQPLSIRSDWRASQQIVLSHVDEYDKPNGLFELRYEDDRYLPFEGTGAVSSWHLELNGKRGSVNMDELLDATITIKYTALQGGEAFADAVRGLLKPYNTVRFLDLNNDFNDEWQDFLESDEPTLNLNMTRGHFPNMASSRITGIFSKFDLSGTGKVSLILNNDETMELRDQQFLETTGLSVSNNGSVWTFTVQGNKAALKNLQLVVGYKAKV